MNVREWIKELKKLDQDAMVVMSIDEEGNGYSPLFDISEAIYVQYDGVYPLELTEEMKKVGYTEEDMYHGEDGVKAVVLYPA